MDRSFWQTGHKPTLLSAFLYFDLSFMVWYLLGPLQVPIAAALGLDTRERALMVATPSWPARCCGWPPACWRTASVPSAPG